MNFNKIQIIKQKFRKKLIKILIKNKRNANKTPNKMTIKYKKNKTKKLKNKKLMKILIKNKRNVNKTPVNKVNKIKKLNK